MPPSRMPTDIAAKLKVTFAALGCSSRKDLASRFRAVNPNTTCETETLNKWMQGRAEPRHPSLYGDWARLLGLPRTGDWIAVATLETFVAEVAAVRGLPGATLARSLVAAPRPGGAGPAHGLVGGLASLTGHYLCYSRAFTPAMPNHLLSGALRLENGRGARLHADYRENTKLGAIMLTGAATLSGRTINVALLDTASGVALSLALHMPGPPVAVMCGLLSGPALVASEPILCCSPLIAVRVPPAADLDGLLRYMLPEPGVIAADLRAIGVALPAAEVFDARARALFATPVLSVPRDWQSAFAADFLGMG